MKQSLLSYLITSLRGMFTSMNTSAGKHTNKEANNCPPPFADTDNQQRCIASAKRRITNTSLQGWQNGITFSRLSLTRCALLVALILGSVNVWGDVLFHENFGNNSGSARVWNDSYKGQSGIEAVYSSATYTMTNLKQGKNTTGFTNSGINQTTSDKDAIFEVGPLAVTNYSTLGVTYKWKAGSIKGNYTTKLYYKTSVGDAYAEVTKTSGTGATSFVDVVYSLPESANNISTLYIKVVFNTSNTSAIIDEFELTGIPAASCTKTLATPNVTAVAGDKSATLFLGDVPNASSYQVQWNGGSWETATSSYTKSELTNGTSYSYKVKAIGSGDYCDSEAATGTVTPVAPTYTITWSIAGSTTKTFVTEGGSVTPPNVSEGLCGDKVFMGWSSVAVNSATKPITNYWPIGTALPAASANVTYYAVFADAETTEGGESTEYTLVTSLEDLHAGDAYLGRHINYSGWKYYYMNGTSISSGTLSTVVTALSSNTLQNPLAEGKISLVATGVTNQYYIKNASNQYLYSNGAGNLSWSTTECAWTFSSMDANYNTTLTSSLKANINLRGYGSNASTGKLKTYSGTTNSGICVFLGNGGTSTTRYSNYVTSCVACTPRTASFANNNAVVTKQMGDAAFTNPLTITGNIGGDKTFSSKNPDVATVDANGQVTIVGKGTTTISVMVDEVTVGETTYCSTNASYTLNVTGVPCTVTWVVNNIADRTQTSSCESGTKPTPPADINTTGDCDYAFIGWTATEISGTANSAPTDLFTTEATTAISGNTTYYAVFKYVREEAVEGGWTLVTDANTLAAGDKVIIAAANEDYAMSTNQKTNNRGQTSITKSGNTISTQSSDVQQFTLKAGTNTWAFYTGSGYIYAASNTSNHLKTKTDLDANGSFAISITDGVASIVAQGANSHNVLRYNASDDLFSCYEPNKQSDVALYREVAARAEDADYATSFTCVSHTLTMAVSGSGTITPAVGTSIVYEGRSVALTARPAEGYTFAGWTITSGTAEIENATSTSATLKNIISAEVTVTANFIEGTYHLVTSAMPALTAGDKVLIASYLDGTEYSRQVIAGDITGNRLQVVDAAFSDDKQTVTCLPAGHTLFTLGGETGAYTLQGASGYLTAPNANNDLAWNGTAATWNISADASGHATMTSNGRYLAGNLSSNYFIAAGAAANAELSSRYVLLYRKYDICGLEVTPTTTKYLVGTESKVDINELTIRAIYTDGSKSKEFTAEQKATVTLTYDFTTTGDSKTVVATYMAANGRTVTGSYTVAVEEPSKIIFKMNSTVLKEYSALSGTKLTQEQIDDAVALAKDVCTEPVHYTFVGWSSKQGEVVDATVNTSTTFIKDGRTFYAVYQVNDGSPITDLSELTDGSQVVLVNTQNYAVNTSASATSQTAGGKIVDPASTLVWTVEKSGSSYKFKNREGKYLSASAQSEQTSIGLDRTYDTWDIVADQGGTKGAFNLMNGSVALEYYRSGGFQLYPWSDKNKQYFPFYIYDVTTTAEPSCGAYLQFTSGDEMYVTGGVGVGGTRSTVIAQQRIEFAGKRLKPSDSGTAPSVGVNSINNTAITIDVTNESVEEDGAGTYNITGYATVTYKPTTAGTTDDVSVQFKVTYNDAAETRPTYTVHTRSLPAQFVIAHKHEGNWYALPGDMASAGTYEAIPIDVNDDGTAATQARNTAIYTFDGVPNTGNRQYVRFIGSKSGGYLWASDSDDTGIRNYATSSPKGENTNYDWLLTTADNQIYTISNGKHNIDLASGRQLGYHDNDGYFGNYKIGASYDLKILPVEDICTYFDAPLLSLVSKKSTTMTLSWAEIEGAVGYEYSTDDGATWTPVANPELTLTGLTASAAYTVLVRATDGIAATNCSEAGSITVQLPDCDDVPTHVIAEATSASVTVSWAEGGTGAAKVVIYTDKTCSTEVTSAENITEKSVTLSGLTAKTVYYVVVYGNGTCASDAVPFQTESPYIDVVEWGAYDGADNTGKYTSGVTLNLSDPDAEAVISVGQETVVTNGNNHAQATDLFFSKYYESIGDLKLIAIYNGTPNDIDISNVRVTVGAADRDGVTESEPDMYNGSSLTVKTAGQNCILLNQLGLPNNKIKAGQEIVIYTWKDTEGENAGTDENGDPISIQECAAGVISQQFGELTEETQKGFEREGWYNLESGSGTSTSYVKYGLGYCNWSGRQAIALMRDEEMIDVIGSYHMGANPTAEPQAKYYAGDGIVSSTGGDAEGWIGTGPQFDINNMSVSNKMVTLSTNRNLLIRLNTTTSGANAVAKNKDGDFVTLSEEWTGLQLGNTDDWSLVCSFFPAVAAFNYTQYYVTYEPVVTEQTLSGMKNSDGTFTIPLDVEDLACKRIKIETKKGTEVLLSTEVRVPIIVDNTQNTHDGDAFAALATIHEGKTAAEVCKTCDVVVKNDAVLTHADNAIPQIGNLTVQDGAKLKIADGKKLTVASVTLRSDKDVVPHLILPSSTSELASTGKSLRFTKRIKNDRYYFFSLPMDCLVEDIMLSNGEKAIYGTDILILYYDGAKRVEEGSSLDGDNWVEIDPTEPLVAGRGYALAVATDNPTEVVFPMTFTSAALHLEDNKAKSVEITAHGFDKDGNNISDRTPNNLGWNFVGNPYFTHYGTLADTDLKYGKIEVVDGVVGETWSDNTNLYVNIPAAGTDQTYTQSLASATTLSPFFPFFVQVGKTGTLDYTPTTRQPAALAARNAAANDKPVFVGISLSNGTMSDETSLVISDRFTQAYEVGFDLEKLLGLGQKPQVYVQDDAYRYAFKALNETDAAATNTLGVYLPAKEAATYTFDVMRGYDLSRVQGVYLTDHVAGTVTNLLQRKYTFTTGYAYTNNRFSLSVVLAPKAVTSLTDVEMAWSVWQDAPQHIRLQGLMVGDDVRVVDATGKLIEHVTATDTAAQFSLPAAGAYCVQVVGVNGLDVRKVVVR